MRDLEAFTAGLRAARLYHQGLEGWEHAQAARVMLLMEDGARASWPRPSVPWAWPLAAGVALGVLLGRLL